MYSRHLAVSCLIDYGLYQHLDPELKGQRVTYYICIPNSQRTIL